MNTKTASGGLNGHKFMLDVIVMQMGEDHGYGPASKRMQLAVKNMARR
jgi:hypothetical protein